MTAELKVLVRRVRRVAGNQQLANLSDRELLQKYGREGNEDAFALVVKRHALLVAGVCRRVLRNEQDVEDAFQAVFLVLYRRSQSLFFPASVAGWLHRVAFHVAIRARKNAARTQALESDWRKQSTSLQQTPSGLPPFELREVLDRELMCLPSAARLAIILCYLEGRTHDQAASQMKCSIRTLDRRLEDGRRILGSRLERLGLDLSLVVLGAGLGLPHEASAAQLATCTVRQLLARFAVSSAPTPGVIQLKQSLVGQIWGANYGVFGAAVMAFCLAAVSGGACWLAAAGARSLSTDEFEPPTASSVGRQASQVQKDQFGDSLPDGAIARLGSLRFRAGLAQQLFYSPDGTKLFACSGHGIRVFDSRTGEVIRELGTNLNKWCRDTLVSPDGKVAAICVSIAQVAEVGQTTTIGPTEQIFLFDTTTGKSICSFGTYLNVLNSLWAFSPDASLLAIAPTRYSVALHDTKNGKLLRILSWQGEGPGDHDGCSSECSSLDIAFSPDGQKVFASAHAAGIIRIFDVATGTVLKQLKIRGKGIAGMKLSPDGKLLAVLESASVQGTKPWNADEPGNRILIVESAFGRQLAEITVPGSFKNMVFAHNSRSLAATTSEATVGFWAADTGKALRVHPFVRTMPGWCDPIALSPDGKWLARGDAASIHMSEIETGKERQISTGHTGILTSLAIHPVDNLVATSATDGRVLFWNRNSGRLTRALSTGGGYVKSLQYSPDGRQLYAITELSWEPNHSTIRCWDARTGKELWKLADHAIQPTLLAISPDNKLLAGLGKKSALIVEAETGVVVRALAGADEDEFRALSFNQNSDELVAWGYRKGLHRWKVASGQLEVSKISDKYPNLTLFSPDTKFIVLGGHLGSITFVNTLTGEKKELDRPLVEWAGAMNGAAYSLDGKRFALAKSFEREIQIVDAGTGTDLQRMACPSGVGPCLAFSSDGKTLVTDGSDGTALVWDLTKIPAVIPAKPRSFR